MKTSILISLIVKKRAFSNAFIGFCKAYCTIGQKTEGKKSEDYFFSPEVQQILRKITQCDYDKVFRVRQMKVKPHKYEFVTDKRLKELQDIAAKKAEIKLQMPPVMDVREPINEIFCKDPELQGYLKNTLIFTDTSTSVSNRHRMITVRETDGTLRKATWEERERMNQIFFPIPGREFDIPKLFESPYLDNLLERRSFEFVLDSACVQFDPDHPVYHKVTYETYECIKKCKDFDVLRSTRHFGPMAFYFAQKNDIDSLLQDMIQRNMISDASDTIELLYILHPELKSSSRPDMKSEVEVIQEYIKTSSQKGLLERALQTYFEQQSVEGKQEAAA